MSENAAHRHGERGAGPRDTRPELVPMAGGTLAFPGVPGVFAGRDGFNFSSLWHAAVGASPAVCPFPPDFPAACSLWRTQSGLFAGMLL